MGTYGFAQFQIDVRKADDDLKSAIDDFKRSKALKKQVEEPSKMSVEEAEKNCKDSEE